jgi:serine/threonine protein kinase
LHTHDPVILHRDLTPDNVVFDDDGHVRLIDFGAAREFLEGITGTMIGKQCYMPPEQLQGCASPRSDIYSFGGTLHFLLTGEDPIALSDCRPREQVECSEELSELIRQCTSFDEHERPADFDQVYARLTEIARQDKHAIRVKSRQEAAL